MRNLKASIALLIILLLSSPARAQDKPNIVLVVMDNLGWGEIGVHGGDSGCPSTGARGVAARLDERDMVGVRE